MLKGWAAFARFLDDGRICLTNNAAERALRGVALGRKPLAGSTLQSHVLDLVHEGHATPTMAGAAQFRLISKPTLVGCVKFANSQLDLVGPGAEQLRGRRRCKMRLQRGLIAPALVDKDRAGILFVERELVVEAAVFSARRLSTRPKHFG